MRLGGVLQAAIDILAEASSDSAVNRPITEILREWGSAHRFAGVKDRAFIGNIVHDALRRRASLQYQMGESSASALAYAALLSSGTYDMEALLQALAGDKFAPQPLSAEQITAWGTRNIKNAPLWAQADVPQWSAAYFAKSFGANWAAEAQALAERPPLDLRVNSLKATRQKVRNALKAFNAKAAAPAPCALRIAATHGAERHPNIQREPAFEKGWFEVQDCGSQMAARLCAAQAGEQILDYCAGGGGKTLALAADMGNRGQIHAYDAVGARLAPLSARARRAGLRNLQIHADAQKLTPLFGAVDCVLLDAPCSGSGTWRRNPDMKWRLTEKELRQRVAQQRRVLAEGAPFVKAGGRLVYVTCSVFDEENNEQIAHFLTENSNFKLADVRAAWAQTFAFCGKEERNGEEEKAPVPHFSSHGVLLSPKQTATDGFFISILERAA